MAYLPAEAGDFLLRTSILDELSGALCDFVLGASAAAPGAEGRGAALLQRLETEGVFITALDEAGTWYRLHPLFRHALQHKLSETCSRGEIAQLYARAVAWHEEHGLLEEAIHYALADQQIATAVGVVQRHRHRLLDRMDFRRLERWLRQFPPPVTGAHVDLLLAQAWLMYVRFETLAQRDCLEQIETLLGMAESTSPQVRIWQGEVATLRSLLHVIAGEPQKAVLTGERALQLIHAQAFTFAALRCCMLSSVCTSPVRAHLPIHCFTMRLPTHGSRTVLAITRTLQARHFIQLTAADLSGMRAAFPKLLQMATARDFKTTAACGTLFLGMCRLSTKQPQEAGEHFSAVLELADYAERTGLHTQCDRPGPDAPGPGCARDATAVLASAQAHLRQQKLDQMLEV